MGGSEKNVRSRKIGLKKDKRRVGSESAVLESDPRDREWELEDDLRQHLPRQSLI